MIIGTWEDSAVTQIKGVMSRALHLPDRCTVVGIIYSFKLSKNDLHHLFYLP